MNAERNITVFNDFKLRVGFWNINGQYELMKSAIAKNWLLSNIDICFIQETHLKPEQKFSVPPLVTVNNPYSDYCKKPRGGVSVLIQNKITKFIKKIDKSQNDIIKVTLVGGHRISCNYIPPADSRYYKDDMFASLANEFEPAEKDLVIFTGGDLNSRIGNLVKKPIPNSDYRCNPDDTINSNGRFLADICHTFKCFPLNNMNYKHKHFDGTFTYYKGDKKSQNDVVIANRFALDCIQAFTIHELGYNISDHFPVVVECNFPRSSVDYMYEASSDILTCAGDLRLKRNKKILQSNVNWENYKKIATTEIELARDLFSQLHVSPSQDQLDCCVTRLSDSLYNTATSCIINTPTSKEENNELDLINTSLQLLFDKSTSAYDRFIHGSSSADDWHAARLLAVKENKKVYFSREAKKWTTVMSNSDTKEIWNRINWKGDIDDSKSFTKTMPPAKDLADHFMTKGDSHDSINLSALPTDQHNELLDRPITLAEVEKSALLIKEKSTSDGWCPKMIRSIHSSLYPSLLNGAESL